MNPALLQSIPAEHRDSARDALAAAFGPVPVSALGHVQGGASRALTYRVDVADRAYLLRIETGRDVIRNPLRTYPCMRIASDAGVAPLLHHADPHAGVAIMDFVAQRPLPEFPGGATAFVGALGELIARLQRCPVFPPLADYPVMLERMLGMIRESGLFAPGLLDPHVAGFQRIRAAYRWDASTLVASHNDANPGNVLFDGQRLWLVDWETAFRNDALADVAIAANWHADSPHLEDALLRSWAGREPDRKLRARLVLMRQLACLYYGCLALSVNLRRDTPDTDLSAPSPAQLRDALASGRLVIGTPQYLPTLGKMFLARFIAGLAAPGFEQALDLA